MILYLPQNRFWDKSFLDAKNLLDTHIKNLEKARDNLSTPSELIHTKKHTELDDFEKEYLIELASVLGILKASLSILPSTIVECNKLVENDVIRLFPKILVCIPEIPKAFIKAFWDLYDCYNILDPCIEFDNRPFLISSSGTRITLTPEEVIRRNNLVAETQTFMRAPYNISE